MDVKHVGEGALGDTSAAHPDAKYQLTAVGDLCGTFDTIRLHRLFTNILVNAATYGEKGRPVHMNVWREEQMIFVDTINEGHVIPKADWHAIFKPPWCSLMKIRMTKVDPGPASGSDCLSQERSPQPMAERSTWPRARPLARF